MWGMFNIDNLSRKYIYPVKYEEYVDKYAEEYNIDKFFIYAIIKTESNFIEDATSGAGARGLMQLMEDAFDWVKYRMADERDISFDKMYQAEYNIQYGTYLIMLLYEEYGDERTALAAYHAGRTTVNSWLKDERYSKDGKILLVIPSNTTEHYVDKVMKAYSSYNNLYNNVKSA